MLDQRRIAQGLEDTRRVAPHVIGDREYKTGGKLAQRSPCAGKCWGIWEKFLAGEQVVIFDCALLHIRFPLLFDFCHMISHTPEHFLRCFGWLTIIPTA